MKILGKSPLQQYKERNQRLRDFFSKYSLLNKVIPFMGLGVVVIFFAIVTNGSILSVRNLQLIGLQSVILIIGTIGASFTISHGNFDLSLGGVLGMSAVSGAMAGAINPLLTLPVCIFVGLVIGIIISVIHTRLKIPTFIITIAMMFIGRGITAIISASQKLSFPASLDWMNNPILYFLTFIVVYIVAYILFEFTKVGKYNKAIGSNFVAATISGIPISKFKIIAFCISGITVGICAFLSMARTGTVAASTGSGFEINVLISLVLGGASLTGGTNVKLRGAIIGCLILTMLENGLLMWGLDVNLVGTVKGIIFIASVAFAYDRRSGQIV